MLTNLLVTCLLGLSVLWCWFRWKHRKFISIANQMPGFFPVRFPILGHIPYTLFGLERATNWALNFAIESLQKEGINEFCAWIGPYPIPVIGRLENIQKILNSSYTSEKGDEMKYIDSFFGQGLLNAPGNIWKIKRRYINPLFHPHNLQHMMPTFNRNSEELVTILSKQVGRGQFEVMTYVMDTALKTICHLIFGADLKFEMTSQRFKGLRKVIEWLPEVFMRRVYIAWLRADAIFQFLYEKDLNEIKKLWNDFTETNLKIARGKLQEKTNNCVNQQTDLKTNTIPMEGEGLLNLLDVHSELEKKFPQFTESDLKAEMVTLYATGSDSIGWAVSTCLLVLAYHQDIQERLFEEIKGVSPHGDVTLTDIQNLPYLDQVYKETLRWSMIVPGVLRKTTEEIKLDTVTIPAGYTIAVLIAAANMDPKIYPNPFNFDPERFSSKNMAERERYSFLPFSGGSRNCIGQTYTNMLMKVMLVHILRKFKLSTTMDIYNLKKKMVITLISKDGYKVILEDRQSTSEKRNYPC